MLCTSWRRGMRMRVPRSCSYSARSDALRFERASACLDPSRDERKRLLALVATNTESHLQKLSSRGAYRRPAPSSKLPSLGIREEGEALEHTLDTLNRAVFSTGLASCSGGDLSYIPSSGLFPSALADFIAAVANRDPGLSCCPGPAAVERSLLAWLCELVGFPAGSGGDLTSGGSIANLSAIVCARESLKVRSRDVERSVVYLSEQAHYSIQKGLHIAGLGHSIVRVVPVDDRYRMQVEALRKCVEADVKEGLRPFLVVASAGTTDVGAVDPLDAVADVAEHYGVWFHVDAAYGGCFLLTKHGRTVLDGIHRADSVTLDPHKGFFVPFGSGALLVRDMKKLAAAHSFTGSYMQDHTFDVGEEISLADVGPEQSRTFRGLRFWLPMRLFGVAPFRTALEEKLALARHFQAKISALPYFELVTEPELSIVAFRFRAPMGSSICPDDANRQILEEIKLEGKIFLSSTRLQGRFTLRAAILHLRTHLNEVEYLLSMLERQAQRLVQQAHEREAQESKRIPLTESTALDATL